VLSRAAVDAHAAAVADAAGGIDIAFNATSNDDVQGTPLVDMPHAEFVRPATKAVTAQVANVAVFLASDWASTMTATEVNITAGAVVD
jgi:enoyl-[acyl-carrier-protein] reductase (NADH)